MKSNRVRDKGFMLAYIVNFLFCSGWGLAALFLYLIHRFFNIPEIFWQVSIAIWFLYPLINTLVLTMLIRGSESAENIVSENKNPYSSSTENYLKNIKK